MPLSDLHWRYVGSQNFVSGIAASHDAVYTLGTATTYADGSARTPGTASAWTWNRQQVTGVTEACYGVPPINALSMAYIVAGNTTTTSYAFVAPDTAGAANMVVYGMNRASGTFTSWSNAQPFTSGFSGYWRGTRAFSVAAYDNVAMWESEEGCVIVYSINATGVQSYVAFGALFDSLSVAATEAETDGRRYTMAGSGSGAHTSTSFWFNSWVGSAGDGGFLSHAITNQTGHCGTFTPGATSLVPSYHFGGFSPTNTTVTIAGSIVRVPFVNCTVTTQFLGQSRQIFIVRDAITKQAWLDGTTPIGYVVAASTTTQSDAALLLY